MGYLVLGLNSAHPDSSAVLVSEKGVLAAIAEERINRKKHCAGFPQLAIQEVLRIAGADVSDLTDVAVAREPKANLGAKLAFIASRPSTGLRLAKSRLGVHRDVSKSPDLVAEALGVSRDRLKARFHNVEHHLAHIASAFLWSPFERACGISIDGAGDFATAMFAKCEGTDIQILRRCHWPHSLGIFYTAVCHFLGFDKFGEEYKVMGLSAYGQDTFSEQMAKLCRYDPEVGIRLNLEYFQHHLDIHGHNIIAGDEILVFKMWSEKMRELFGEPRKRGTPLTDRDRNMSASMQRHFEVVYKALIADAVARTGVRDAVMAGGCVLNGVGNGKVLAEGILDRIYMHPAAGDDGTAAGAAMYVLNCKLGVPRTPHVKHAYWGTSWSDDACEAACKEVGVAYTRHDRQGLIDKAADALSKGAIMGWFQGREEWGPRALGNRSILCHPGWPDMKAILNARVKNREPFRPFAPAVLMERLNDCFEGSHEVPFMNIVFKVRPEWRQRLSATTHEDFTGRVQTVSRDQNDMYYDLIKAFESRTGTPVLLNTSFNENEPIVHTPKQAIDCFLRTRMDALAVGGCWIDKPNS